MALKFVSIAGEAWCEGDLGRMAELADARDLKSLGRKLIRVRIPLRPPHEVVGFLFEECCKIV